MSQREGTAILLIRNTQEDGRLKDLAKAILQLKREYIFHERKLKKRQREVSNPRTNKTQPQANVSINLVSNVVQDLAAKDQAPVAVRPAASNQLIDVTVPIKPVEK